MLLNYLWPSIDVSISVQITIIALITSIALISVVAGMDKGLKDYQ